MEVLVVEFIHEGEPRRGFLLTRVSDTSVLVYSENTLLLVSCEGTEIIFEDVHIPMLDKVKKEDLYD